MKNEKDVYQSSPDDETEGAEVMVEASEVEVWAEELSRTPESPFLPQRQIAETPDRR